MTKLKKAIKLLQNKIQHRVIAETGPAHDKYIDYLREWGNKLFADGMIKYLVEDIKYYTDHVLNDFENTSSKDAFTFISNIQLLIYKVNELKKYYDETEPEGIDLILPALGEEQRKNVQEEELPEY